MKLLFREDAVCSDIFVLLAGRGSSERAKSLYSQSRDGVRNIYSLHPGQDMELFCHTLYDPPRTSARLPLYRQDETTVGGRNVIQELFRRFFWNRNSRAFSREAVGLL